MVFFNSTKSEDVGFSKTVATPNIVLFTIPTYFSESKIICLEVIIFSTKQKI